MILGCWKTDLEPVDTTYVPFQNDYTNTTTAVVETVVTGLSCPDGEPARFYAVYDPDEPSPQPVVIVLHSAVLDYVYFPKADSPLAGEHYAPSDAGDHRLSAAWGIKKTWETLGMYPQVDSTEDNLGTLPAQLANDGVVALYPANCWGDLWHNSEEFQPNDSSADLFWRNGMTMAWWMVRAVIEEEPTFLGDEIPEFKSYAASDNLHAIGLGDGARGVYDLVYRLHGNDEYGARFSSVVLDSPVDDLNQWAATVTGVQGGLDRIFYGQRDTPGLAYWSLPALLGEDEAYGSFDFLDGTRVGIVHSSIDPRVPSGNLDAAEEALGGRPATCVVDTAQQGHVFLNADTSLARDLTQFAVRGIGNSTCQDVPASDDTGD